MRISRSCVLALHDTEPVPKYVGPCKKIETDDPFRIYGILLASYRSLKYWSPCITNKKFCYERDPVQPILQALWTGHAYDAA